MIFPHSVCISIPINLSQGMGIVHIELALAFPIHDGGVYTNKLVYEKATTARVSLPFFNFIRVQHCIAGRIGLNRPCCERC